MVEPTQEQDLTPIEKQLKNRNTRIEDKLEEIKQVILALVGINGRQVKSERSK